MHIAELHHHSSKVYRLIEYIKSAQENTDKNHSFSCSQNSYRLGLLQSLLFFHNLALAL